MNVQNTSSAPTTIATYGTPRSSLATATTIASAAARPPIRSAVITVGSVCSPALVRERTRASCTSAYSAVAIISTHAAPGAMKSLARPMTKSFCRITVPRLPISSSTTPFQASRPASVTTNEGTPILVMIRPWNVPMPRPAASTITITTKSGARCRRA